jgi:hypothetical protein
MVTSFWQISLSLALFHPGLTNRLFAPIGCTKHAMLRFSKMINKLESKHVESVSTEILRNHFSLFSNIFVFSRHPRVPAAFEIGIRVAGAADRDEFFSRHGQG